LAEDGVPAASASAAVLVVLVVLLVVDWVGAPGKALVGEAGVAAVAPVPVDGDGVAGVADVVPEGVVWPDGMVWPEGVMPVAAGV
jgi:hypothetical protein